MGTLVCTIRLDKADGGVVTIENADGKITQSITMNGTSIVIEVKGDENTSTITQTSDGVSIKCKTFLVEAETITCKSTKATLHQSEDTLTLKSTKDMQLTSSANLAAQATSDLTGKGANVKLTADNEFAAAGMGASFKAASTTATVEGVTVKLSGSGEIKAEGAAIELTASGMLKAEASGIMNIKGGITNIEGSLVKLG